MRGFVPVLLKIGASVNTLDQNRDKPIRPTAGRHGGKGKYVSNAKAVPAPNNVYGNAR